MSENDAYERRFLSLFLGLLLTLSSSSAWATDLSVSYWVDAKALRSFAPAGTMLTFELHQDSACSSAFFTEMRDVDTLSFGIEKLKLSAVTGSDKPPKPARINAMLSGVTPAPQTYLKVTGSGIVPVNGACQLQVAGPSGIVSMHTFDGEIIDSIPGPSAAYVFAGPTALVTVSAGHRVTVSAQAALGKSAAGTAAFRYGACSQLGAGTVTNFVGGNYTKAVIDDLSRLSFGASASGTLPSAGTYQIGFCVQNDGLITLDNNDFVNGWIMVTN